MTLDSHMMRLRKRKTVRNNLGVDEDLPSVGGSSIDFTDKLASMVRKESKGDLLRRLFMEEMRERE